MDGGISRGFELQFEASPLTRLDLRASYTFTNSDEARSTAGTRFSKALGLSEHVFTMEAYLKLTRRLDMSFEFHAADDYFNRFFVPGGNREFRFDGPVKADATIGYAFPLSERRRIRLYGRFENIFDDEYFENGFRTPGATGYGGLAFEF